MAKKLEDVHYSRLFGRRFDSQSEDDLVALALRMKDVPENRRGRRRGGIVPFSGFVYLGQFIDHDMTRDETDLASADTEPGQRVNKRVPYLDLDSVYANGPEGSPLLYDHCTPGSERFVIGKTAKVILPGAGEVPSGFDDLYRPHGIAAVGDDRNDENLIIAQLHVVFLKFHNRMLDYLKDNQIDNPTQYGSSPFQQARQLVIWHYQWLVRYEFLPMMVLGDVLSDVLDRGPQLFIPAVGRPPALPVEFTHAAFRFGHSMVQDKYNLNNKWSTAAGVPLHDLLSQTPPGKPGPSIGADKVIEWAMFTGEIGNANRAEDIDTLVTQDMYGIPVQAKALFSNPASTAAYPLPAITLLRGSRTGVPSGQEACAARPEAQIPCLPENQIGFDDEETAWLSQHNFLSRTPLWYYILREAEVAGVVTSGGQVGRGGECLGPLGSRIVAEVILGVLAADPHSYEKARWGPPPLRFAGSNQPRPIKSLRSFIAFALDISRVPEPPPKS